MFPRVSAKLEGADRWNSKTEKTWMSSRDQTGRAKKGTRLRVWFKHPSEKNMNLFLLQARTQAAMTVRMIITMHPIL
jgi:hypothetical protein